MTCGLAEPTALAGRITSERRDDRVVNPLDRVDTQTILAGQGDWIDDELATSLAAHPLACVDREYPHYVRSVDSPDDTARPSDQHPVFYGCYDWHSAVHSHWSLVRQLRLIEGHPDESAIETSIDARLTPDAVAGEVAFFTENETFERPYGWGWLLRLAVELRAWDDGRADRWAETLRPLESTIVDLVETNFLPMDRLLRVGTHGNSAFALACVLDYARAVDDTSLESKTIETAERFFADDRDYSLDYEPIGWDFLSPGLAEADLMRRIRPPEEFTDWFEDFLPAVVDDPRTALPDPIGVAPGTDDGMALHLVGLDLSRAWCLAGIADVIEDASLRNALTDSAGAHAEAGLELAFTDDYDGAHWLTSFVCYLVTRNDGLIAPPPSDA